MVYPLASPGPAKAFVALQRGLAGFRRLIIVRQIDAAPADDALNQKFLNELKRVAAFSHPFIPQVHGLSVEDGVLAVIGEFYAGATLAQMAKACLGKGYSVPVGFSLRAAVDAAFALHYAHTFVDPLGRSLPVVHRGVNDQAVLVTFEGVTKLLDLGVPKAVDRLDKSSKAPLDPALSQFISPEQARGQPLDARSDVFSLGAVLHSMLTGLQFRYAELLGDEKHPPSPGQFPAPSSRNPDVPLDVDGVLRMALSPNRQGRYASALEFGQALQNAAGAGLWQPDQCGGLVLQFFTDDREKARLQVENAEAGSNTAVMPLSKVMTPGTIPGVQPPKPSPLADEPTTAVGGKSVPEPISAVLTRPVAIASAPPVLEFEAEPLTMMGSDPAELLASVNDIPDADPGPGEPVPTQPLGHPGAKSSAARSSSSSRAPLFLLVAVGLVGATGAGLWFGQPALAKGLLEKAQASVDRLLGKEPPGGAEPQMPPATAVAEEEDAGLGSEIADAGSLETAPDAGDGEAALDAGQDEKNPASTKKTSKKKPPSRKRRSR